MKTCSSWDAGLGHGRFSAKMGMHGAGEGHSGKPRPGHRGMTGQDRGDLGSLFLNSKQLLFKMCESKKNRFKHRTVHS